MVPHFDANTCDSISNNFFEKDFFVSVVLLKLSCF